jgi:hypothetical protein
MFIFDVETLGKRSNSVILSMACIYFNPDDTPSYQQMYDGAFFAKFDVIDQMKRLDRTTTKSTMDWWAKQCDNVKNKSFKPNPAIDVKFEDGYESMREWAKTKNDTKCWVWARGNLDQLVMDDIEEQIMANIDPNLARLLGMEVQEETKSDWVPPSFSGLHNSKRNSMYDHIYKK